MSILNLNTPDFRSLAGQILGDGHHLRFMASGTSMHPFIQDGDILEVTPPPYQPYLPGDIVLVAPEGEKLLVHRVVKTRQQAGGYYYLIKGDHCPLPDGWFRQDNILGWVETLERGRTRVDLTTASQKLRAKLWVNINPWISKLTWLPLQFRQYFLHQLLPRK